jgi:predicted nucleotidyltransferase
MFEDDDKAKFKVGDTVKVNRYDSDPYKATIRVSYELAEVVWPPGRMGSMCVLMKTGEKAGVKTTVMANTCEVIGDVISHLGAIPDAGKVRLEAWFDRDDVTQSG